MLALGIHRKSRIDSNSNVDSVDLECRKRTFWCAYSLDTYLSAALGRPRSFHDEDIDQELPLCLDDSDLIRGQPAPSPQAHNRRSTMSGAVAHIRISRIVANILRELYGIRRISTEDRLRIALKYDEELEKWLREVSYLVNANGVDSSLLQPIFLRQRNVLILAHWRKQLLDFILISVGHFSC